MWMASRYQRRFIVDADEGAVARLYAGARRCKQRREER